MRPLIYNKTFLLVIEMATSNIIKSFSSNLLVVFSARRVEISRGKKTALYGSTNFDNLNFKPLCL